MSTKKACTLLIVDDEPYLLPTLTRLLEKDFQVLTADSADAAQNLFKDHSIDIILTDQRMPRRTGTQLLEWVRAHSPQTVRILMTGFSELDDAVEAINRGQVYHYLHKPWRAEELLQILRNAREKVELEQERERLIEELCELNAQLEQRVGERTAELEQANQLLQQQMYKLELLAQTDALTGLRNRRSISDIADREIHRHARYPTTLAMGIVDVDRFKDINTNYLLTGGDAVLKSLARILVNSVRSVDAVGRLGGEEFMVVAPETTLEGAEKLAERIRSQVAENPIHYRGNDIRITVSVGFVVAEVGAEVDFDTMHHIASDALREAKESGRNRCVIRTLDVSVEQAC